MTFDIHPDLERRFMEILSEELPRIQVRGNSHIDVLTTLGLQRLDKALPGDDSEIVRQLHEFIGEEPAFDFFLRALSEELSRREPNADLSAVPITSLAEFADIPATAQRLYQAFKSLPSTYTVFVALPEPLPKSIDSASGIQSFLLSSDLPFWKAHEGDEDFQFEQEVTGHFLPLLFGGTVPTGIKPDVLYLKIDEHGNIGQYGSSSPLDRALATTKSVFGLGLAVRLFRTGPRGYNTSQKSHMLIYERASSDWSFLRAHELTADDGQCIAGMGLDSSRFAKAVDEPMAAIWMKNDLESIGVVLRDRANNEKLLRAAEWLFDSHAGENQLLSFVQATVVLEILLGEYARAELGLGELLGNRCAYLIGTTRKQRDRVLADFKRIYDTRSKIVHRGMNRLSKQEQQDLWMLHWMCGRVLQEEIKLLQGDARES